MRDDYSRSLRVIAASIAFAMVAAAGSTVTAADAAKDNGLADQRTERDKLIAEIEKGGDKTAQPGDAAKSGAANAAAKLPGAKPSSTIKTGSAKPTTNSAANSTAKSTAASKKQQLLDRFDADHDGKLSDKERLAAKHALDKENAAAAANPNQPAQNLAQANGQGAGGQNMRGQNAGPQNAGGQGQAAINGQGLGAGGQGMGMGGGGMGGQGMGMGGQGMGMNGGGMGMGGGGMGMGGGGMNGMGMGGMNGMGMGGMGMNGMGGGMMHHHGR